MLGSRLELPHSQESRDAELAFRLGEKNVRLGLGMSAVASHKSGKREDVVAYFGVIDFLQGYGVRKAMEHAVKAVRYGSGKTVSVCSPEFYAKRFIDFVERVFV